MFCSTIIPTIGRPTLSRAVESVLSQNVDGDFEIIVVNDSGRPLPNAAWQCSKQVKIIHTNRHNRSVARNAGAAIARGRYLHFLDDDDWMLPNAFESFWELAHIDPAAWLYGAFKLVDNDGDLITTIYPEEQGNCFIQLIAWEWLPLQASLIESEAFFKAGGFASLPSLLGGCEDTHLSRQISRYYELKGTSRVVACIRAGDVGSTTDYANLFRQNRQSREKTLNIPGAFTRMRLSARASLSRSGYWSGQIVYYYLASILWNTRRKHFLLAASRGVYAIAGFAAAGSYILSSDFWRGLLKPHFPRVRIATEQAGTNLYGNTNFVNE